MRPIAVLLIIGAIAGGILGVVYQKMHPLIVKNSQQALKEAVLKVLPKAKSFTKLKKDKLIVYKGLNGKKQPVGWAFIVETAGFQGIIKMMVGVDKKFQRLTGLQVLENVETPGLGARVAEADFQKQFVALTPKKEIILVKNQAPMKEKNEIEAISGATISSRAVVNGLNKQIFKLRQALGK